jgi:hypothetical protein
MIPLRNALAITAGAILLSAASAANATVFTSTVDLNPNGAIAGATYTDFGTGGGQVTGSFTESNAAGGNIYFSAAVGGGGAIVSGSVGGSFAQPAGATGNYLTTGFTGAQGLISENLKLTGLHNYIGLYWGSIDTYNLINLYNGDTLVGTITGDQVGAPANGDQANGNANRYVNISSDLSFDHVQFVTTSPAFEVDNIALTAAVPEASTWGMMILGFLGIGFLGYRRSPKATLRLA